MLQTPNHTAYQNIDNGHNSKSIEVLNITTKNKPGKENKSELTETTRKRSKCPCYISSMQLLFTLIIKLCLNCSLLDFSGGIFSSFFNGLRYYLSHHYSVCKSRLFFLLDLTGIFVVFILFGIKNTTFYVHILLQHFFRSWRVAGSTSDTQSQWRIYYFKEK